MAEEQPPADDAAGDPAAEAFEALRAEVAQVRAAVEALSQGQSPDYSPTLGVIAQRLDTIEGHPALQLTPEGYRRQVQAATDYVRQGLHAEFRELINDIRSARVQLQQLGANLRARDQQDRWLLYAAGAGAALGVFLWVMMSGPIARQLPASWHVPEKMAARTLALDRWEAGGRLMQSVSPKGWVRLIEASEVEQANRSTLENCRAAALRLNKAQPCTIRLQAPSQVAPP